MKWKFVRDALASGFTMDDVLMAEDQLLAVEVPSPEVRSVSSLAGKSRVVQGVAQRQVAGKPWRGPFPPRRSSPSISLGDALDKAVIQAPEQALQNGQEDMTALSPFPNVDGGGHDV